MARKATELGPLAVSRLTAPGLHAVGGVSGLALQVLPSGGRSWILRATIAGKRRDIGLGGYPDQTLAGARQAAREAREVIRQGGDPIEQRKAAKSALRAASAKTLTFKEAAVAFIVAHEPSWKNPKHRAQWSATLERYAYPAIGELSVKDVELAHVLQILEPIWSNKTETASRLRGRVELVLDWATARGFREGLNPARWREPLEEGGSVARTGFIYQDHVAAGYSLRMLADPRLKEVWCEAEDDITLIWDRVGADAVELVQVKSDNLNQLWSIALLCGEGSSSIAAKSLAHDRCAEPCTFRLVTRVGVRSELKLLCLPLEHDERSIGKPGMLSLHRDLCQRLVDVTSPRGRSPSHWVADLVWEVAESETALKNANLNALDVWLEKEGISLFSDQRQELYERLLRRMMRASLPRWRDDASAKKLLRGLFAEWMRSQVAEVQGVPTTKSGEILRRKMAAAGIDTGVIDTAADLRRRYRQRELDPKYMSDGDTAAMEAEAIATLNHLLSRLDSGALAVSGVAFHTTCLDALHGLKSTFPTASLSALQAVMYVAAERCRHRFVPAR